jgi:hypothetical protein
MRVIRSASHTVVARIAYSIELALGETRIFPHFLKRCRDFDDVYEWITDRRSNVILLIDELNVIPPEGEHYARMSHLLDNLACRKGSAVMYSTHCRSYADILRGRSGRDFRLSTRPHEFLTIPRVAKKALPRRDGDTCVNMRLLSVECSFARAHPSLDFDQSKRDIKIRRHFI